MIPLKLTGYVFIVLSDVIFYYVYSLSAVHRRTSGFYYNRWSGSRFSRWLSPLYCVSLKLVLKHAVLLMRKAVHIETRISDKSDPKWTRLTQLFLSYELVFCSHTAVRIRTVKWKWHGSNVGSNCSPCLHKSCLMLDVLLLKRAIAKSNAFVVAIFFPVWSTLNVR